MGRERRTGQPVPLERPYAWAGGLGSRRVLGLPQTFQKRDPDATGGLPDPGLLNACTHRIHQTPAWWAIALRRRMPSALLAASSSDPPRHEHEIGCGMGR